MKIKSLFRFFLVLIVFSFAGCDKNDDYTDVTLEETYIRAPHLQTQAKEGGEALITVTDKKSGKTAECSLFVSKDGIPITNIRYGVEANQQEAILADLEERELYPIGTALCRLLLS